MSHLPRSAALAACVATMIPTGASAALLGLEIREDKNLPSADGLPGFPGAARVRVFNFYAKFDGDVSDSVVDSVLSVGQPTSAHGFGIFLAKNPGSNLYHAPGSAGGGRLGGRGPIGDNRRFWDTFVSIGVKAFDPDYGPVFADSTALDPDFETVNRSTGE